MIRTGCSFLSHKVNVRRLTTLPSTPGREDSNKAATLILLRHGQSTWNATPTFTGWCDVPLTDRGVDEAKASGRLLKRRGFHRFDAAFTSQLQRAKVTCELALEAADISLEIMQCAWQLNERHYGALQGHEKNEPELLKFCGMDQMHAWRRDFHARPPAMDTSHPYFAKPPAPLTESLADCQKRVLNYWDHSIAPTLIPGSSVLLVAHSNTLRALVAHLDDVPVEKIPSIHIPNSVPCVYMLDENHCAIAPVGASAEDAGSSGQWMFSAENSERLHNKIGSTESFGRSIFEAWDANGDGRLSRYELDVGLTDLFGSDNPVIAAIAAKVWEEMDRDPATACGHDTVSLEEFQSYVLESCRKNNLPFWMDGNDTENQAQG